MVHRGRLIFGSVAIVSLIACKKPPPADTADGGAPIDHLAPDEIPEGSEKAFSLVLPKGAIVIYRVQGAVEVETELSPEKLANYVRKHVQTTKITRGAGATAFDDAVVPSTPQTRLHIDVRPPPVTSSLRSSLYVRDTTPPPSPPKTTDADAYKNIGRNPDGTPIDPKHMF